MVESVLVPGFGAVLLIMYIQPVLTVTPCIYEGNIATRNNWYGFLANVTFMRTGRIKFTFVYPVDKCCQNILFYTQDQISVLKARMNCWQKEGILHYEQDQVLRLTPSYTWSGCHIISSNGVPTYVCEGGRSFVTHGDSPKTWNIALANCASLHGLKLKYKLELIDHVGICKGRTGYEIATTHKSRRGRPAPTPSLLPIPKPRKSTEVSDKKVRHRICVIDGILNTTRTWAGFLTNFTLVRGGVFRFMFTYPEDMQIQNVILYTDEDTERLEDDQTCWQREGIIRTKNVPDQIIDLSFRSSWNGCISKMGPNGPILNCQGERRYNSARTLYVAVSNCRSTEGLYLNYHLSVTGYMGDICSAQQSQYTVMPSIITLYLLAPAWLALYRT